MYCSAFSIYCFEQFFLVLCCCINVPGCERVLCPRHYVCSCPKPGYCNSVVVFRCCLSYFFMESYINKAGSFLVWIVLHFLLLYTLYSLICGMAFAHFLVMVGRWLIAAKFCIILVVWWRVGNLTHCQTYHIFIFIHVLGRLDKSTFLLYICWKLSSWS